MHVGHMKPVQCLHEGYEELCQCIFSLPSATTESPSLLSREVLIGVIAGASGGGLLLLIILIVIIIIVSVCVRMRKNNRAVIEEEMTFKNKTVL